MAKYLMLNSGNSSVWLGGVTVGAAHHLHCYFKSPLWENLQKEMAESDC